MGLSVSLLSLALLTLINEGINFERRRGYDH